MLYIHIRNFAWEDQSQKQCYIADIEPDNTVIEPEMKWKTIYLLFSLYILMDKAVNSRKYWDTSMIKLFC